MRGRPEPLSVRLWSFVDKSGGPDACWPFTGYRNKSGYGKIGAGDERGTITASRAAYEEVNGPIPEGVWVLHECDNPPCCNPGHLFLGDALLNVQDMDRKGRRVVKPLRRTQNGCAKLTEDQVAQVLLEPDKSLSKFAAEFGVSKGAIAHIRQGRSWTENPKPRPSRLNKKGKSTWPKDLVRTEVPRPLVIAS